MTLAGQRLGPYDIMEEIGRGGMAVVYQAYDRAQRRVVALKVLPPYLAHDPDLVRRFVREGQECRALQHPHIVHTYDAGEAGGVYYMAMEYLPGGSLAEALARQGHPFDLATAVGIVSQIASALDYAHQRGMLHRDVKLRNILLDGRGRAALSDFGIAKVASHSTLTPARALLGTAYAMSPEQARGDSDLDRRSDVYALGVALYELLTGQPPFRGEHDAVILHGILYEAPRPPRSLNPAIPPAVERVILTALQKDRNKRYATAGQLAAALQAAAPQALPAGTADAPTRAATPARPPQQPPPRRAALPSWAYVAAGGGIVLAALLIIWALAQPPALPPVVTAPTATASPTDMATPSPFSPDESLLATASLAPLETSPAGLPIYVVQPGDVFATIAIRFGVSIDDLAEANSVVDGNMIFVGQRLVIPASPTATFAATTPLPPAPLAAPELRSPDDGDTLQERVQFRWGLVPNAAGYQVETRSDRPGQTDWRAWDRLSGGDTTFNLTFADAPGYFTIPGTVYSWRVAALDAAGRPTYSAERTFVMQRAQPVTPTVIPPTTASPTATPLPLAPLAAPQLQGPSQGETVLERIEFRWVSVPNATGYQVETRSDRPGQTDWRAWYRLPVGETIFNLPFADAPDYFAIPGTVYYWRVAALDAAGRPTYSAERAFVMQRAQAATPTPRPTDTPPPPTAVPPPTPRPPTEEPPPTPSATPVP